MKLCPKIAVFVLLVSLASVAHAQSSPDNVWTDISTDEILLQSEVNVELETNVSPVNGRLTSLDLEAISEILGRAKGLDLLSSPESRPEIPRLFLPTPDGEYVEFEFQESEVMSPELAVKFPEIKTYTGTSLDDASTKLRFDLTPSGFHGQVLAPGRSWYIDPNFKKNSEFYVSYYKENLVGESHTCMLDGEQDDTVPSTLSAARSGNELLTYRLAVATTGEYGEYHGGTKTSALAAVVTTINRVTGIYEKELAIRLVLVAETDSIVFTSSADDPFTGNNNASVLIDESQNVINEIIGSANYDIGHTFSTGGGGFAAIVSVCDDNRKARGITGANNPAGDPFDVDFVAHEIGHQFGGGHTFNGAEGACAAQNRFSNRAFEPGSGSTIQAYAGICGSDDLQANSDPVFHSESHSQIIQFVTSGNGATCASTSVLSNAIPDAEAGLNFTIPKQTPFVLTGGATDADAGDVLSYMWEQRDLGPQAQLNAPDDGQIPLFRAFTPSLSPMRFVPSLETLSNNTTDPSEKLPTLSRVMNWRLSVRDNQGGVDSGDIQITVDDTAGPFVVTSPNGAESISGSYNVTWDVASTDGGSVASTDVDILLSLDSGLTFDFDNPLVSATSNDGSQSVVMPSVASTTARVMIKGANSIFFDISDQDFSIAPGGTDFELAQNLWQNISLPAVPPANANTVADIFSDDISGDYGDTWQLFEYDSVDNRYVDVGLDGTLEPGAAYWIIQTATPVVLIDLPAGSTPTPTTPGGSCTSSGGCLSIALDGGALGWQLFGNPFYSTPDTNQFRVTSSIPPCNTNLGCSLAEATAAPAGADIIDSQFSWWNGGPEYESVGLGEPLEDWKGYWARVYPSAVAGGAVLRIPRNNLTLSSAN